MRVKCALCGKDLIRKDTKPLNHFCSAVHQYIFNIEKKIFQPHQDKAQLRLRLKEIEKAFHQFNIENEEKKA